MYTDVIFRLFPTLLRMKHVLLQEYPNKVLDKKTATCIELWLNGNQEYSSFQWLTFDQGKFCTLTMVTLGTPKTLFTQKCSLSPNQSLVVCHLDCLTASKSLGKRWTPLIYVQSMVFDLLFWPYWQLHFKRARNLVSNLAKATFKCTKTLRQLFTSK